MRSAPITVTTVVFAVRFSAAKIPTPAKTSTTAEGAGATKGEDVPHYDHSDFQ
jgi:hypothetical protein